MSRILLILSTPAVLFAITACYMALLFIVAIEPFAYLQAVLASLPTHPANRLDDPA